MVALITTLDINYLLVVLSTDNDCKYCISWRALELWSWKETSGDEGGR